MLTLHYETTFLTLMELVQPLRGGWRVLANSLQLLSSGIHQALCTCPTHGIHGTGILNLHLVVFNGTNGCYGLYNIWMCTKAMCSKQTLIHKNCKHMAHRHECTCKFHLTATGPLYIRAKTGETEWFDVVCTATTVAACTSERTILLLPLNSLNLCTNMIKRTSVYKSTSSESNFNPIDQNLTVMEVILLCCWSLWHSVTVLERCCDSQGGPWNRIWDATLTVKWWGVASAATATTMQLLVSANSFG